MKQCIECGYTASSGEKCPECGNSMIDMKEPPKKRNIAPIIAVIAAVLVIGAVVGFILSARFSLTRKVGDKPAFDESEMYLDDYRSLIELGYKAYTSEVLAKEYGVLSASGTAHNGEADFIELDETSSGLIGFAFNTSAPVESGKILTEDYMIVARIDKGTLYIERYNWKGKNIRRTITYKKEHIFDYLRSTTAKDGTFVLQFRSDDDENMYPGVDLSCYTMEKGELVLTHIGEDHIHWEKLEKVMNVYGEVPSFFKMTADAASVDAFNEGDCQYHVIDYSSMRDFIK